MKSKIIIFKNDRTGDLITSLPSINLLIKENPDKQIIIYLSEINYRMKFLFNYTNVNIRKINYNLSFFNRLNILYQFTISKISEVYIFRPKNFFFLLPIFFYFKNIKFYGFCLNGVNNYKRPNSFLRRFLFKYIINDRGTRTKRVSRQKLHLKLIGSDKTNKLDNREYNFIISNKLKTVLPKDYLLIHYKKKVFQELGWGIDGLEKIINKILEYYPNVILINDIEPSNDQEIFKNKYRWHDLSSDNSNKKSSSVLYLPNISGLDMFNVIKLSKKTIAVHGTITLLGNLLGVPILDIFYCNIKNSDDFYRYKNAFHEWKPNDINYNFIVPSKNLNKTINKMLFSLKNAK